MKLRIAAAATLAAGLTVGLAGCGFTAPQLVQQYSASDGVNGSTGRIDVRNALLVTNGDGEANLVVGLVNNSASAHAVRIEHGEGSRFDQSVTVPAGRLVTLGGVNDRRVILSDVDARAGSLYPVYFQYGNQEGVRLLVPVLNGQLSQYSDLVPATPEPTAAATPSSSPTSHPTQSPAGPPIATESPTPTPTSGG